MLAPELQRALRRGELAIREARQLARVPLEQQVARWQAALDKKSDDRQENSTANKRPASPSRVIASALKEFDAKPQLLADALRSHLGPDGVKTLLATLAAEATTV